MRNSHKCSMPSVTYLLPRGEHFSRWSRDHKLRLTIGRTRIFPRWQHKRFHDSTQRKTMPPISPRRGEIWSVDFGMAAKVRPALVLSIPFGINDRALLGVVPHTTSLRGSQFETVAGTRFLKQPGGFLVQGFAVIPPRHFIRRLGVASDEDMIAVEESMRLWLGLSQKSG